MMALMKFLESFEYYENNLQQKQPIIKQLRKL